MSTSTQNISLDFSPVWQEAIVGHMLRSYSFFLKCYLYLKPEWFTEPTIASLVKEMFKLYDRLDRKRPLTGQEIVGALYQANPVPTQYSNAIAWLKRCDIAAQSVGLDLLQKDITTWVQLIKFREAMYRAEALHNKKDYEKARVWLQETLIEIGQISFNADDVVSFDNPHEYVANRTQQFENCLTTGSPELDSLLLKTATDVPGEKDPNRLDTFTRGCLVHGDTTILMGASNAGKTSALITMICANIRLGKMVLYLTHEQKPEDIRWRLLQCMTGLSDNDLLFAYTQKGTETRLKLEYAVQLFNKYLRYISFVKPGEMWVENVIARIRAAQETCIAQNNRGFDLLAVDYPGKLNALKYANKRAALWEEGIFVYDQFVNLARHYNMHAILPVQTNRTGFRINRNDNERMLDQDDIGGAYGIMQLADNVITINRGEADVRGNTIMFHIAKCRSNGERYGTFVSHVNLAVCRTHGLDLKGMKYNAASAISKQLMRQQLLQEMETKPLSSKVPNTTDGFEALSFKLDESNKQ